MVGHPGPRLLSEYGAVKREELGIGVGSLAMMVSTITHGFLNKEREPSIADGA